MREFERVSLRELRASEKAEMGRRRGSHKGRSKPYYNTFESARIGKSLEGISKPYSSAFKSVGIVQSHKGRSKPYYNTFRSARIGKSHK